MMMPASTPSAPEVCDGLDQDYDGVADDGTRQSFSLDLDGDGFGGNRIVIACDLADAALQGVSTIRMTAMILLRALIQLRTSSVTTKQTMTVMVLQTRMTPSMPPVLYADSDLDGFGDLTRLKRLALCPLVMVDDGTDCNDALSGVNPGATEDCLTADDDDCDGSTNTPNAIACSTFYYDEDGDNFGIADSACLCTAEAPYQAQIDTDCDDTNVDVNPGELEIQYPRRRQLQWRHQ